MELNFYDSSPDPVSGLYPYDHYDCSTYALTFHRTEKQCGSHYISTRALRALILDTIRMVSAYAIEAYATDKLPEKRFTTLSVEYEQEQAELEAAIAEDEDRLTAYEADTDRVDQFLALARRYTDFSVLTNQMILEFVDKIIVHAPVKVDGEREQEVEIYLKFIGKFDVPCGADAGGTGRAGKAAPAPGVLS